MGYGAAGVMFPIIWAEYGVNSEWRLGPVTLDAYTVNAIGSANAATNPSFTSTSDKKRQALGFRLSGNPVAKTRVMLSGYSTYWSPGNPLFLGGIDASTDYGLVDIPGLKQIRLAAGAAAGFVRNGIPDSYRTYGDYLQLSTNAVPFAELRARYGTYIDNSRVVSAANSQALSLGAYIPVDVMNLLAEYQFNYEEVNETKNDLVRFMLALDF